jgi:thioredoxin reductase (NADPH)
MRVDPAVLLPLLVYAFPAFGVLAYYLRRRAAREGRSRRAFVSSRETGLVEPVSLHPVVNPNRCMGCGACVDACPEGSVLGVVGGQAELVNPTHCIGHGRCAEACPTDAIALAIGSHRRGVEIPVLGADFQTSVRGIYVAGELGGMGLIRNAIEQGRRAVEAVRKLPFEGGEDRLDLVIVGAGPAGFSASLAAKQHGLAFATFEQDSFGGSIAHNPRGKIFVTEPVEMPIVGEVRSRQMTKEQLLEFWEGARRRSGVTIREREKVETVNPIDGGFEVRTTGGSYPTRAVLLAVGRRGTPRRLEVPGEELPKVVYRLSDPEQYRGQRVLVVGGGDSALEAAIRLAGERRTCVCLAYRGSALSRPRPANRARLEELAKQGRIEVELGSVVREIGPGSVLLEGASGARELGNDAVVVCAGGVLPTGFLRTIGVRVETRYGTPLL